MVTARERWLAATLSSIGESVVTTDRARNITFMNAAAERLSGRSSTDMIGRPLDEIMEISERAEGGATGRTPGFVMHAAGDRRVVAESSAPIVDGGETVGTVIVIRDITNQKISARKLELEQRQAAIGTMASRLAHQVNNPLAVVVMHAESVREELLRARELVAAGEPGAIARLDDALAAHVELGKAVFEIAQIMTDMRAFSQPSTSAGNTDLRRAIEWAVKASSHEFRDRARVRTNIEVSKLVELDEPRLGQLLVNLLVNAAAAIEPGAGERNTVTITARMDGEDRVVIEVVDTGRGMTADVVARAFEPALAIVADRIGIGLGLASARAIARSVGGEVELVSAVGAGTTVRVVLPIAVRTTTGPLGETDRARVLVIDDDDSYLRGVRRTLRGHDVTCCATVGDALDQMASHSFDVVLAEMRMPDMSGIEMYQQLLQVRPELARRVVFVAQPHTNDRFSDFLAAVPNQCVEKPMEPAALRALVRGYVTPRER